MKNRIGGRKYKYIYLYFLYNIIVVFDGIGNGKLAVRIHNASE